MNFSFYLLCMSDTLYYTSLGLFQLYAGLRNGKVQCFNCSEKIFTTECDCTGGEGTLVGLGKHKE